MNSYRGLLLELSNSLTSSDLEGLKFLCREVIPAGRAEKITRPFEFFSALEQLNMLSEENRDFLASQLIAINRNDLRNKLLGIQGDQNVQFGQGAVTTTPWEAAPTGLYNGVVPDSLVHDLVEDLSTSWRMLGRRLGLTEGVIKNIDSEHRRVIEKGVAMFDEWKNRRTNDATMHVLREGLEKIGRRDLSEKVRDFALREQEELINAAAEHEQRQIETATEERRPFPNLQDLGSVLPPSSTGMQRQPEEQAESIQRPVSRPAAATASLRDQAQNPPAPKPPNFGGWDLPVSRPAPATAAGFRDQIPPAPNPAYFGGWDLPLSRPAATTSSLRDQAQILPAPQPANSGGWDLPSSRPAANTSSLRDQAQILPAPQPANSGGWDLPSSRPAANTSSLRDQAQILPEPQPVNFGGWDLPSSRPVATLTASLRAQIPHVSQPASAGSDLPVSVPVAAPSSSDPSHQIPPAALTVADPSLPYPTPVSQPTMEEPSLPRPAPAATPSGPPPLGPNDVSTDATAETPEANPRQVQGSANAGGFTGRDITDNVPNDSTGTGVPVASAPKLKLTAEGCYLNPEKYEPVKLLGSGGFAKVYLCKSKESERLMAVKMCDLGVNHHETQKQAEAVSKEVAILKAVKHKYIVEFLYVEESHNTLLLFLEYMEGGSVEELLRHRGPIQEEALVRKFTRQILTAVGVLHNKGIIHKDIKGGNVLLDKRQMNIKIADFGISKVMQKLKTATGGLKTSNRAFSLYWTSPELLAKKPFGRNTDIWSVGCTVVEMLTTKPPLMDEDSDYCQIMFKIANLEVQPPRDCTSLAYGFIEKCLCASDVRPSAAELLETDPFVNFTEEERNQLADLLIDIDH